jgi:tetratricopeptide (TPR) repeat protein
MTDNPYDRQGVSFPESLQKDIITQIGRLPDVDVPEGLSNRIMTALRPRKRPWWRTLLFRLSRPGTVSFTPLKWAPVGAALMVGLIIGFNLDRVPMETAPLPGQTLDQSAEIAEVHYQLGRLLLADDQTEQALVHLRRAADTHPDQARYHFWVGVNYWTLQNADQERAYYQTALALDPDFLPAHVYLGHNHLDQGDWQTALRHYERVLQDVPDHPEALFNRGVALHYQGETHLENDAWAAYLEVYDRGEQAIQAAAHLNANGDFTFRRIQMGPLELVKRRISFRPGEITLGKIARDTLGDIGRVLANNRKLELHIVAYVENNAQMAKLRAKASKQYLAESAAGISPQRLKTSWFNVPEIIQLEDHTYELGSSIHVFATTVEES